jgi:hypothetical protein
MDIILTFDIIMIIYQNFNVKVGKLEQPTNLGHPFHSFFLYKNSLNFMFNLQ